MRASSLLRAARRRAGLTQRELATRTSIPQTTIARIELGRNDPRASTLNALLLGCGQVLIASAGEGATDSAGLSERARRYLPEITRRLVDRFHPARIILFGSQANGRARSDSDVDLLVLMDAVDNKRDLRVAMRESLADIPIDKDVLVASTDEAIRRLTVGDRSVIATALQEGLPVYGR